MTKELFEALNKLDESGMKISGGRMKPEFDAMKAANPTTKDGQTIDSILRPALEYASEEFQGSTMALDIIDGFIDEVTPAIESLIEERCAEAMRLARIDMRQSFLREFTNDHNGEIRWLRGITLSRQGILVKILYWFDSQLQAQQSGSQEDNG